MILPRLPMGCLSSRSTIAPSERVDNETTGQKSKLSTRATQQQQQQQGSNNNNNLNGNIRSNGLTKQSQDNNNNNNNSNNNRQQSVNSNGTSEDDIMSILMNDKTDKSMDARGVGGGEGAGGGSSGMGNSDDRYKALRLRMPESMGDPGGGGLESTNQSLDGGDRQMRKANIEGGSFDEEPNMELLRQYVAIDYEITLLEDKDALRIYHEKIEQLEELERELDMLRGEAEEVASRSESAAQNNNNNNNNHHHHQQQDQMTNQNNSGSNGQESNMENNSILSGATGGSISRNKINNNNNNNNGNSSRTMSQRLTNQTTGTNNRNNKTMEQGSQRNSNNLSYSTVEEVFNRKILLEKERDKLKKEVEMVIIECDKLQQRYKKRDEILDKLFDGRTGNGLENHLEQQLNWLLEQKHYVDQVFYAWKRAETLNSQTCEQFTNALELLKRLPKIDDPDERSEIIKSIGDLLIKSRQDIEQAQQYNPNVDAPFFTDNETERFDTIIEQISTNSISQSEYSQVLTVIQFAYKRAVNIRLWLEQILQTTIARDSFELAEEYKWIAIQLRKERINLIKAKLQSPAYQPMVQSIQEQMARQQTMSAQQRQHEINRDSGIESETNDIDIEEEIYRLLEMNRSRLETSGNNTNNNNNNNTAPRTTMDSHHQMMSNHHNHNHHHNQQQQSQQPQDTHNAKLATRGSTNQDQQLKVQNVPAPLSPSSDLNNKDKKMRQRIQKRVKGDQPLLSAKITPTVPLSSPGDGANTNNQHPVQEHRGQSRQMDGQDTMSHQSMGTPTRLKIELDEEAKQSLLKQVDQIHMQHKSRIERLRGNNRAKAADSIMNRMQQLRENQTGRDDFGLA